MTPEQLNEARAHLDAALSELNGLGGALDILGRLDLSAAISRDIASHIRSARAAILQEHPNG